MNDIGLTREQKLELSTALILKRVHAARRDFAAFLKYVWANESDFQLADFHLEAIEAYTNPKHKFVYWEAPRGHAKSLITSAFVTWSLGRDPNHRIKLICANDKEARKRLYEIKLQIEKNPLLQLCFPGLKRPKDSEWNKSRIIIDREIRVKDPSVEAMGIMSGALGSRATLIVLDDIVDMRNSILQPLLKEQVLQKLFGEIIELLEPEGRLLGVGTPWTLTDANATMKERPGFKLVGPHRVGRGKDLYEPIWPYKFTRESLKQLRDTLGPAEYARAYLCQALTGDTVPIQGQWIKFYDANLLGDPYELFCIQAYDLAIEQTRNNDYFAYVTGLWCQKRNYIFICDAWHDRISFRQQAKSVIDNAGIWHPQEIVIENGGYQGSLASYLQEDTKIALPIWPFFNRGRSKERRLVEAQPLFEKGRVFFHPKFDPRRNPDIIHNAPMVEEIVSFPFHKFDDFPDAVSMLLLTILEMSPDMLGNEEGFEEGDGMQVRLTTF